MDAMTPFLQAITEEPDDDTHRLVFSDWLDDHGQSERAEFIRLQVDLARMDAGDEGYAEKTARMRRCGVFTRPGTMPFFDHLPTAKCRIGFRRGMIAAVDTADAEAIDASGLDLVPVEALRTSDERVDPFRRCSNLKWLEYHGREATPARLLELLGPGGWFKHVEELSLPYLNTACLAAGVVPRFDLPRLRNFYLSTDSFYSLGRSIPGDREDENRRRAWAGLPAYLPANAIPNPRSPLERFVWHSNDDCDFFNDEGWYWRGPPMGPLLAHLRGFPLKQVEVAVDYDDHESGREGVIAAPYEGNPLDLSATLERVTVDASDLQQLDNSSRQLRELRVYAADMDLESLGLLDRPDCSLESLTFSVRGESCWGKGHGDGPAIDFPALKSLHLSGVDLRHFTTGAFPNLISLSGTLDLDSILERKWSSLQRLSLPHVSLEELRRFAQSDCFPRLTTLVFDRHQPDLSDFAFLANCPHMPLLSLVHFPHYSRDRAYVVAAGELVPVRPDVMVDEPKPTTLYNIPVVF